MPRLLPAVYPGGLFIVHPVGTVIGQDIDMDNTHTFPLSLDFEGKHYNGTITPSDERATNGVPVFFRVELGDTFFAYLCCSDHGWKHRDEGGSSGLINAIGNYIFEYYE